MESGVLERGIYILSHGGKAMCKAALDETFLSEFGKKSVCSFTFLVLLCNLKTLSL